MGAVLAYAVFKWGGVLRSDQFHYLLVLGLLAVALSLARPRDQWAPLRDRAVRWTLALLPSYILMAEGITTDQGIRFQVSDTEVPARLDVIFGQFKGTTPWSPVEQDLAVPPQTNLLRVQVIRQPSMKFDNKVSGTSWIDELRLKPIGHPSSP